MSRQQLVDRIWAKILILGPRIDPRYVRAWAKLHARLSTIDAR